MCISCADAYCTKDDAVVTPKVACPALLNVIGYQCPWRWKYSKWRFGVGDGDKDLTVWIMFIALFLILYFLDYFGVFSFDMNLLCCIIIKFIDLTSISHVMQVIGKGNPQKQWVNQEVKY